MIAQNIFRHLSNKDLRYAAANLTGIDKKLAEKELKRRKKRNVPMM